nr:hypothetical protein [Acidobacteriota bacterium]
VLGVEAARAIPGVSSVEIVARQGALLERLPEGGTYPGFVFASGTQPDDVIAALQAARATISLVVDRTLPVTVA